MVYTCRGICWLQHGAVWRRNTWAKEIVTGATLTNCRAYRNFHIVHLMLLLLSTTCISRNFATSRPLGVFQGCGLESNSIKEVVSAIAARYFVMQMKHRDIAIQKYWSVVVMFIKTVIGGLVAWLGGYIGYLVVLAREEDGKEEGRSRVLETKKTICQGILKYHVSPKSTKNSTLSAPRVECMLFLTPRFLLTVPLYSYFLLKSIVSKTHNIYYNHPSSNCLPKSSRSLLWLGSATIMIETWRYQNKARSPTNQPNQRYLHPLLNSIFHEQLLVISIQAQAPCLS